MIVADDLNPIGIEERIRTALAAERKADRVGAAAFVRACRDGDVDALLMAVDFLDDATIRGWQIAMRGIARLPSVSPEIRAAFLSVWIESKHIPLKVGHRPTMARALHVLMPPVALDEPLILYRGTTASERSRRAYGFSWSMRREIAERFAEQASVASGGAVLLETVASAGTVHLRREDQDYYDESEVVVDPYRLGRVHVLARLQTTRVKP